MKRSRSLLGPPRYLAARRMRGEKRDVIGNRPFNPFFFDEQVRKFPALDFCVCFGME
jgi:hypothetical protein